jgi:hypothetical protein
LTSTQRTVRRVLTLAVLAAIGWWIHEKKPTVQGVVDDLTRPLLGSRAAVRESERKRVVGEASQVLTLGEEKKPIGSIREGMSESEVRRLLGDPDEIQTIVDDSDVRVRWTYRSVHRVVVFDRHRVVSIAIR